MDANSLQMPKHASRSAQKVYTAIACAAALVSVTVLGLNQVAPAKEAVTNSMRAVHLLPPVPVKDQGCLTTGWMASGATWESASHDYMEKARAANPDYIVEFKPGREYSRSGPFNTNVQYRFEGCATYTPRWQGLI